METEVARESARPMTASKHLLRTFCRHFDHINQSCYFPHPVSLANVTLGIPLGIASTIFSWLMSYFSSITIVTRQDVFQPKLKEFPTHSWEEELAWLLHSEELKGMELVQICIPWNEFEMNGQPHSATLYVSVGRNQNMTGKAYE